MMRIRGRDGLRSSRAGPVLRAQQFSRALSETSGDVASIQGLLETLTREAQNLLDATKRVSLPNCRTVLMRHTHGAVPAPRATADPFGTSSGKTIPASVPSWWSRGQRSRTRPPDVGAHGPHRWSICCVMPLSTASRARNAAPPRGKPDGGRISINLTRDGAEVVIVVADDGSGINVKLIPRGQAVSLGLVDRYAKLTGRQRPCSSSVEPGLHARRDTYARRPAGVGMDVVATEVKSWAAGCSSNRPPGRGFTIHRFVCPSTLAIRPGV